PLLKKASELEPNDADVQLKLGEIYLSGRQYNQAQEAAQQVLQKQPGQEQALLLLADAAVTPEDIEETRKQIENLRGSDQDRAGCRLALGALALKQKDEARAENEFKAALQLNPKSDAAHSALAILYLSRKDTQAADQALKTAADVSPSRPILRLRYAD